MQQNWQKCIEQLEAEMTSQKFTPWIKPLRFIDFDESNHTLKLGLANALKLNIVRTNFLGLIEQVARQHFPDQTSVQLELSNGHGGNAGTNGISQASPPFGDHDDEIPLSDEFTAGSGDSRSAGAEPGVNGQGGRLGSSPDSGRQGSGVSVATPLNPDFTFDNLVQGKSNQMAVSAALQVVERPGLAYNPLFLYGGVGLGKTHLLNAIGNAFTTRVPRARIACLHAQTYFNEMVHAIQRRTPQDFKRKYQSLDFLLIDDIQFLGNRERTQEEFFYTFEAMFSAKKQMIITCDTYPRHLSKFQERLVSRFGSGLIVEIEPPELEMRIAILQRKTEQLRANNPSYSTLPDEVADFIAHNVRSNVRELEGALLRVYARAAFHRVDVTLAIAREACGDLVRQNQETVSIEQIQKVTADFYKMRIADMYSKRRPANIARARQIAMYLTKEMTLKSFPEIGEAFGGRDHTTVMHAAKRIAQLRATDSELNRQIHQIEQSLRTWSDKL